MEVRFSIYCFCFYNVSIQFVVYIQLKASLLSLARDDEQNLWHVIKHVDFDLCKYVSVDL